LLLSGKRGEGKGREGKGREGKGREGKGREGKGTIQMRIREPQKKHTDLTDPDPKHRCLLVHFCVE
jgi:hypothetical protein